MGDTPLPPESPEQCRTDTTDAPSAKSSTRSTDGDQPPFRRPTTDSTGILPGVDDYLTGTQKAAEAQGQFTRPKVTAGRTRKPVIPMGEKALEVAARLKELFYLYDNRRSDDNRSAQQTMGPSEIGSPCDRRIAMSLLRLPPVNPGGDGWAAFRGTCVHVGLAEMLMWGNAGSGRYQTEVQLEFPSLVVPFGTTDAIDTALLMDIDHKVMGGWSLNKLMTEGPTPTYRVQAHTYGMGARLKGYDIKDVAIVGWPSDKSSLDDLYVWTEPYDPAVAREAIARVERISESVEAHMATLYGKAETGKEESEELTYQQFPIDNSDCKFCPWHLPGAAKSEGGVCNGRG
jgi:hypothetical protein